MFGLTESSKFEAKLQLFFVFQGHLIAFFFYLSLTCTHPLTHFDLHTHTLSLSRCFSGEEKSGWAEIE